MKFRYDDQIASQPDAVAAVLARAAPPPLDLSRPVLLSGLGTSLHAARVAERWINERGGFARACDAHELALRFPTRAEQVVAVSHRGGGFAEMVLRKARAAGARTFAVVSEDAPEPPADLVVRTCGNETAGTHTVSYLTALTALGQLVGVDLRDAPALLRAALAQPAPVEAARTLVGRGPLLIAGVGVDAIGAAEAALKLKEACFVWAEGMSVELAIHGPLVAVEPPMAALTFTPSGDDAGRTEALRDVLRLLAVPSLTCGTRDDELRFPECSDDVRPLVSAIPLQRLAAELARLTGGDPDTTRAKTSPWCEAIVRTRQVVVRDRGGAVRDRRTSCAHLQRLERGLQTVERQPRRT